MGVSAQLSEGVCASVGNSCALIHYIICKVVKFVFINTSFFLSFLFAPSFIIPPWVCHSFTFASPSFHTFHWNTSFCLFSLLLALFSIHLPHSPAVPRPLCALLCPLLSLLTISFSLSILPCLYPCSFFFSISYISLFLSFIPHYLLLHCSVTTPLTLYPSFAEPQHPYFFLTPTFSFVTPDSVFSFYIP